MATLGLGALLLCLGSADAGADPKKFRLGDIPLPDAAYQRYLKAPPFVDQAAEGAELAMPPSCALKKEPCDTRADCCSGRCNLSKGTCL